MYITLETDYAIRIVDTLARDGGRMGAKLIADQTGVTLRFALKILRKLVASGIIRSYKGAQGGYEIARPLNEISLSDVLETIEGPFTLNRCAQGEYECSRMGANRCQYHYLLCHISDQVSEQLKQAKFSQLIEMPAHECHFVAARPEEQEEIIG